MRKMDNEKTILDILDIVRSDVELKKKAPPYSSGWNSEILEIFVGPGTYVSANSYDSAYLNWNMTQKWRTELMYTRGYDGHTTIELGVDQAYVAAGLIQRFDSILKAGLFTYALEKENNSWVIKNTKDGKRFTTMQRASPDISERVNQEHQYIVRNG